MAAINPTVNRAPQGAQSVISAQWALGNADTGNAITITDYFRQSVQVEGTFGAATIVIQGSNDGVNWETLRDRQGNTLSFTSAGLKSVQELVLQIRAASSGGTGTAVTATLIGQSLSPRPWN